MRSGEAVLARLMWGCARLTWRAAWPLAGGRSDAHHCLAEAKEAVGGVGPCGGVVIAQQAGKADAAFLQQGG